MRRTLLCLCAGLVAFAAGVWGVRSFEMSMYIPADLVPAPAFAVETSRPEYPVKTCKLHNFEMHPERTTMEGVTILSYHRDEVIESVGVKGLERWFPNCCNVEGTTERNEYGEVYLLYVCDKCVDAYRAWEKHHSRGYKVQ
jgi:hypothetical protein